MKYIVALTGGIGSGKSTIANAFSQLGISIVDSDIIARKIIVSNKSVVRAIDKHFGNNIFDYKGILKRRLLRKLIFTDTSEKKWLNALLHPLIYQETQRQISMAISPYILWVIPLLIENHLIHQANRILVADTTPQIQLYRTMIRDNISYQNAERILSAQAIREDRLAIADDIINNSGAIDTIAPKVAFLHSRYLILSRKNSDQKVIKKIDAINIK